MENTEIKQMFEIDSIRTIVTNNNELWFVSNDIPKVTGHVNIRDAVKSLDFDEKDGVDIPDITGRIQNSTIINESGFYKLMFRSKLPQAKIFTKKVTSEILPQIRKTGSYNPNFKELQELANDKETVKTLTNRRNEINKEIRFFRMRIEKNEKIIYSPLTQSISAITSTNQLQQQNILFE